MNKLIAMFLILFSLGSVKYIDKVKLQEDIDKCPYSISEYDLNKFDCSNMSAMLGEWLTINNYKVKYCRGKGNTVYHAWLIVGKNIYVESTTKKVTDKKEFNRYCNVVCANSYDDLRFKKSEWIYPKERFNKEIND